MSHKFDPRNFAKLDNPERRKMLPPEKVLQLLKVPEKAVFADIGAGIGYFTFPASILVGKDGQVFALDTSKELLLEIKNRAKNHPIRNIKLIQNQENNLKLPDNSIDFAFLSLVLHEVEDAPHFIFLVSQALKTKGRIAILDWEKKETPQGPPLEDRIEKKKVLALLQEYDFIQIQELPLHQNFYCIQATKV